MTWRADSTGEASSDPDTTEAVGSAPARPLLVEFGAAILVIGGAFGLLAKLFDPLVPGAALAFDPVLILAIVLDVLAIAAGVLLRTGRTWIVAANLAAVLAFLHLVSQSVAGIAFAAAYLAVVAACFLVRDWFDAMKDWRIARFEARLTR